MAKNWPADNVERRKVSELVPYARNARTHSEAQIAQIAASIGEWGWTMPVLVDEEGGVIAGHGRILAAELRCIEDVPTMTAVGWTEAQKRAYVIADNKLALEAGWDMDMLGAEFTDLKLADFDLSLTGFGNIDLAGLGIGVDGVDLPAIASLPEGKFQQMAFIVQHDKVQIISEAIRTAVKEQDSTPAESENCNGQALARICENFLSDNGPS